MEGKSSIICINSNSYWELCLGRQTLLHVMGPRMPCSRQSWGRRTWPPVKMTDTETQELNLFLSRCKGEGRIQTQPEIYNHCTCHYFNLKFHIIPPSFAEVQLTCNMWVKVLSLWCVREGGVWSCWLRVTGWGGHLILKFCLWFL